MAPTVIPLPAASGEKAKARDILAAIRTLKTLEAEHRHATPEEARALQRFGGFGPVALGLFPDPVTGRYKDPSWEALGHELESLLSPEEYASAKRTTFNAFYTSPLVIGAMHEAVRRLGVPEQATILEPGCGTGNFLAQAARGTRCIGVELDSLSGRIARALYPEAEIRIENFRDTKLPANALDAVLGNVPFADVKLDYQGEKLSLHDFFFAKSLDALKPGGVLALVTSHWTLDKQNAAARELMAAACRLPRGDPPALGSLQAGRHAGRDRYRVPTQTRPRRSAAARRRGWLESRPMEVEGASVPINGYFQAHPEMVLGTFCRKDRLYGGDGYSVTGNGDLGQQLQEAIRLLPERAPPAVTHEAAPAPLPAPQAKPADAARHITEGSFFIGDDRRTIYQLNDGVAEPVVYGGTALKADGTMTGKRLAALIGLRDMARAVLAAQNEGGPEASGSRRGRR